MRLLIAQECITISSSIYYLASWYSDLPWPVNRFDFENMIKRKTTRLLNPKTAQTNEEKPTNWSFGPFTGFQALRGKIWMLIFKLWYMLQCDQSESTVYNHITRLYTRPISMKLINLIVKTWRRYSALFTSYASDVYYRLFLWKLNERTAQMSTLSFYKTKVL